MTSPGSSTTQISARSRRSSVQIVQRGPSARLKQTSQRVIFSLTSRIASASAWASCGLARRTWKASRWAVRLPMPGSLPSSVTSRWTGGASKRARRLEAGQAQPAEPAARAAEAARHVAHLARRELLGRAQRLVDGGQDGVLEHLDVLRVDRARVDGDRLDREFPRRDDLHHAPAGRGLDALVLEGLLRLHHLLLHLLDLLEHLLHVRLGRHQGVPWGSGSDSGRISASNSSTKRSISSSSDSARASASGASARISWASRSDAPVTALIARPITSRFVASSAFRRERPWDSAHASVSSPSPSEDGRATLRCSASSGRSPWIDSITAGHRSAKPSRSSPTAATTGSAPGASGSITATAATAASEAASTGSTGGGAGRAACLAGAASAGGGAAGRLWA